MTGYARSEIIPRNCRFLQGYQTDRVPVKRIRAALNAREELVELLLNYKKNGEPFWNLLYISKSHPTSGKVLGNDGHDFLAPLCNAEGNVVFFLGGQINCSTTIQNCSDVLRILSQSANVADESEAQQLIRDTHSSRGGLFKSFKKSSRHPVSGPGEVGMESTVLHRIEKQNIKTQMDMFYTAYSKVSLWTRPPVSRGSGTS